MSLRTQLRHLASQGFNVTQRALGSVGLHQSEDRISADSQNYWSATPNSSGKARSHWRDAHAFEDNDLWRDIGRKHLEMYQRFARTLDRDEPTGRVLDWGCGGGANAVQFAPRAREFIGVEISEHSLRECERQVAEVCDTPFTPVLVEVGRPEDALAKIGESVDAFLCFYVFELIPSPEYGARLLRIASSVLAPGGVAIVQIRYSTGSWWTKPRRRHYRSGMATMTTYPIDSFWQLAESSGLRPVSVELVPENELDERYAYFLLTK